MKYTVSVLNYSEFFKLIYGNGGLPKDKTVFERIRFLDSNTFNWSQETSVKPYFIILQDGKKVIGLAKIGYYDMNASHEKDYSLAFLSIDINYRNMGLTRVIADKMFEFLKEQKMDFRTSTYTYVGKIKLQKILNEMAVKWDVKFLDKEDSDGTIDYEKMYDENLNHKSEIHLKKQNYITMKKTLLILENDWELKKGTHVHVLNFKDKWDGDVIELTGLKSKSQEHIYKEVIKSDVIAVQTCFINGSDSQFFEMFSMLSKISNQKEIYIYLIGDDLKEHFIKNLDDKDFYAIQQHKIYAMASGYEFDENDNHQLLDFSEQVNRHALILRLEEEKKKIDFEYAQSSNLRKTGRKIKILGCTASGEQFRALPIGQVVDELDMSATDPNSSRGVWVWGKTEAVKLVNDCGMLEYEVVSNLTSKDIMEEIGKSTAANLKIMKGDQYQDFISLIEERHESSHDIAQYICDELGIERRGNRSRIRELIEKYNSQFEKV